MEKVATFRVHKNANYTVMSNHHLRDKEISLKAKGLLSVMLSLPDDWDYSINGLAAISKEGTKAIRNILQELEEAGYLTRTRKQGTGGRFEYDYDIYEHPQPRTQAPHTPKGHTVEGHADKDIQLNTELLNTNKQNKEEEIDKRDKIDKRKIADFSIAEPSPFTKELIKAGYIEKDDLLMQDYNDEFNRLLEENEYEIVRSCLWYFTKQHQYRKGIDENGQKIENKFAYFKNAMENNISRLNIENKIASGSIEDNWLIG